MPVKPYSFAARLGKLRNQRSMSKTRLANLVGVSTTCVWNWEEGNTEPRSHNLSALADALGVSSDYLEFGTGRDDDHTFERPDTEPQMTLETAICDAKILIASLAGVDPRQVTISVNY
jgi:transcriptional regulator with XRE-family HTH domain